MAGLTKRINTNILIISFFLLFQAGVLVALAHKPTVVFMWFATNVYFLALSLVVDPFKHSTFFSASSSEENPEQKHTFFDFLPFVGGPKQKETTLPSEAYKEIFSKTRKAYQKGIFTYGLLEDDPIWRRDCRGLFLSNLTGERILEIGVGPGLDAERLNKEVHVTGVDLSAQMIRMTKNRCRQLPVYQANSLWLPFQSNSFDGIFAQFLLLHLPHSLLLRNFQEWKRVLKKNGILFFTFVDHRNRAEEIRKDWLKVEENECPLFYQQPYHVKNFVHRAGFSLLMHTRENPSHYQARDNSRTTVHQFLIRAQNE